MKMELASGRLVNPLELSVDDVELGDIAHALSLVCRYGGHASRHYSVAEHSLLVERIVRMEGGGPELCLWALLHDASEAYLGDMIRPLKRLTAFAEYREIEARAQRVVCARFGLTGEMPEEVKSADNRVLANEAAVLMRSGGRDWGVGQPVVGVSVPVGEPDWRMVRDMFKARVEATYTERGLA
ncbi:hypothetical protein UFOVP706_43 [uncultured Caudovirales phage]|uniref:Phosphohydrolase n=1 Tax=uncultured Caudovirales phage TaxID=2100421 RepID=A0A6J5NI50_9CAUD|nr:hypothetical protein UFOVP706_43 [uncultured Caudovirales phage]